MQSLGTFWLFTKNQAQSTKHILFYIISVWRHYRRSTDLKKFQYQPIGLNQSVLLMNFIELSVFISWTCWCTSIECVWYI